MILIQFYLEDGFFKTSQKDGTWLIFQASTQFCVAGGPKNKHAPTYIHTKKIMPSHMLPSPSLGKQQFV